MEEEKITDLFSNFQPELSSSFGFMTKLKRTMEAVEIVKQHNSTLRKRNRVAVAVAAVSGFLMGVVLTLLLPLIRECFSTLDMPLLQFSGFAVDYIILWWMVVAAACVLTAINAYEIAMAKLPKSV